MVKNKIESTAIIGPHVKIGVNNYIGHYTVIDGDVTIGDNNFIGNHVVIGSLSQNSVERYELNNYPDSARRRISIGSHNVIREFSTVHLPMEVETSIADNCYLMAYNHVSHDTRLENNVILSNNTQIGGFTTVQEFANIGLSTIVHQRSTIGAYSMIGMGSVVSKDVPPFLIVKGVPVSCSGKINEIGLQRNGFSENDVEFINNLYFSGKPDSKEIPQRLQEIIEKFRDSSRRKIVDNNFDFEAIFMMQIAIRD